MLKTQLSLFYSLQHFIQTLDFYRKYYLLFKSLDLSDVANKNHGIGCTGHSRHAMIRAFIVKHFEEISSVLAILSDLASPQFVTYMDNIKMLDIEAKVKERLRAINEKHKG